MATAKSNVILPHNITNAGFETFHLGNLKLDLFYNIFNLWIVQYCLERLRCKSTESRILVVTNYISRSNETYSRWRDSDYGGGISL